MQIMGLPIVIVGGGLGGLAAAIRLATQGRRVIVCEKNERLGGKLNLHQAAGYTFDTGPSLLTMPWVVRDLFAFAQRRMEDYLCLEQIEPTCRYFWPDGTRFDAWQRLPQLVQEIERISPVDVPHFFQFMAHTARIYDAVAGPFLLRPFDGLRELITPSMVRHAFRIDALRSVDAAVRSFFRSPHLRQLFNRYATYNGSSPYVSPATFNLISYIELAEGGWYVHGGMYQLAVALGRLAAELGVEVRTETPVSEVIVEKGYARGVRLAHGGVLPAAAVVINADPQYAYTHLIPGGQREATRLARFEPSYSGVVLFLGVEGDFPALAHHTIFFSADYPSEFRAIVQDRRPALDPTIYIAATCRSDPTHAPPGHMNLFVLVNAPADDGRIDWEAVMPAYRDHIIAKLEVMGLSGLRQAIRYESYWTPRDLAQRYNAAFGAIYGLSSNSPFAAFARSPLRARRVKQLYFVGGGTHPGGGIPLVLLSGKAVTSRILADQGA
ncbi:phytoene desaturase family protein [Chloroflexus aggregans]|uniref:4,4'-diaponeurosporene oxygenase n=1 Tax=Chloroflexus aggregans (strain MD-66 / DSM 9485) TaxID=326427 RepID=B8G6N4_CHLAD|nr:phytoene desaturase [Chloroflexus aggregans DSM 9485]